MSSTPIKPERRIGLSTSETHQTAEGLAQDRTEASFLFLSGLSREALAKTPFELLQERLKNGGTALLAGGCGTEINRREIPTDIPLWSASALITHPEVVRDIHRDYIKAGSQIITTNTFRTNERTFAKAGLPASTAKEMTIRAVRLAREAREQSGRSDVVIGGSVGPIEDCYSPELTPPYDELLKEHTDTVSWLKEGGVDLVFFETINTIREAKAAAAAAHKAELPFIVSFVCDLEGNLLSGEAIEDAVREVAPFGPTAFGTNCRPLDEIEASVDRLLAVSPVPVAVYANGGGKPEDDHDLGGWKHEHAEGKYCRHAGTWLKKGVRIVGGCCGTTPEYTHDINARFFQA